MIPLKGGSAPLRGGSAPLKGAVVMVRKRRRTPVKGSAPQGPLKGGSAPLQGAVVSRKFREISQSASLRLVNARFRCGGSVSSVQVRRFLLALDYVFPRSAWKFREIAPVF